MEQLNLNLLLQEHKVHRVKYFPIDGFSYSYVYHLLDDHSPRTLDHELDITLFHINLHEYCEQNNLTYIWQQKHMTGRFYPDAYFEINGLHYFLEIERQPYGNVRNGKPSIIRKADLYYEYYDSKDCADRWGFKQFRVIFQLKAIKPQDFLARLPKHRMYWVGVPDTLEYQTPKGDTYTFVDV